MARLLAISALVLLLAPASAAGATTDAPEYTSSEPAKGEELHQAPETVTITFSEPLDGAGSTIEVSDDCGDRIDDGDVQITLNEMSVGIAEKPSGIYTVHYVATGPGGVTGTSEGSFRFTVHAGSSCSGAGGGHEGHGGHEGTGGSHNGGGGAHEGGAHHGGGHGGETTHESGEHGAHEGHAGSGSTHSGHTTGHQAGEHSGGHGSMQHEHGKSGHTQHHGGGAAGDSRSEQQTNLASGAGSPNPANPDSVAVLLALVLCAGFGILGGWVLRVSAPK